MTMFPGSNLTELLVKTKQEEIRRDVQAARTPVFVPQVNYRVWLLAGLLIALALLLVVII